MAENWEIFYEVERAPTYYVPVEPPKQRRWIKWVVIGGTLAVLMGVGAIYGVVENNRLSNKGWDECTHNNRTEICAVGWSLYDDYGSSFVDDPGPGRHVYGIWFRISPRGSDPAYMYDSYVSARSGSGTYMTHYFHYHPGKCHEIPDHSAGDCVLTFEGPEDISKIIVNVPLGFYTSDPSVNFELPLLDYKYRPAASR